jgi:DNA-binding IclR family transcriptional regulator
MLAILDLFTEEAPAWTAEEIIETLGYSRPTGYRYVRELCAARLLRRGAGSVYLLGTRIVELDYQLRVSDPVLIAGREVMRGLCAETGCDVMLAGMFDGHIVTIHQEHGAEGVSATFGRGRLLPRFRGTMSKTILAWLPRARLRKLYERHADEAAAAGMGRTFDELLDQIKSIRSAGHSVTRGELDPGLVGISVPVHIDPREPLGSLGLVMTRQRFAIADPARLVAMLSEAAARIDDGIERRQKRRAQQGEDDRGRRTAPRHTAQASAAKIGRLRAR